jgi:hypothetical protein
MAGGVRSALVVDANRRRRKAQQHIEAQPERQITAVHNTVVAALAELPDPKQALAVVTRIQRQIADFIANQQ